MITHQPHTDTKKGKYWITLILRDDDDHEFVFTSTVKYANDESGKAHFDMSTIKTADFDYK